MLLLLFSGHYKVLIHYRFSSSSKGSTTKQRIFYTKDTSVSSQLCE